MDVSAMETVDQSQELSDCGWGRPGSCDSSVWSDPSEEKVLEVWGRKVPGQGGWGGVSMWGHAQGDGRRWV